MGYRGKVELQAKARRMRAENRTLRDIADTLGVSKSSVSLWVRDIPVEIRRGVPVNRRTSSLQVTKLAEIEECNRRGGERLGALSDEAFLAAGAALYAGEGSKSEGKVLFANTSAEMVAFFCAWLRGFFVIDEARMRVRVYLHDGLDLDAAEEHWSLVTGIPRAQFRAPYRAVADSSIRSTRHEFGCGYVYYCCSRTHREVMGWSGR
jgi:hypothetical protein